MYCLHRIKDAEVRNMLEIDILTRASLVACISHMRPRAGIPDSLWGLSNFEMRYVSSDELSSECVGVGENLGGLVFYTYSWGGSETRVHNACLAARVTHVRFPDGAARSVSMVVDFWRARGHVASRARPVVARSRWTCVYGGGIPVQESRCLWTRGKLACATTRCLAHESVWQVP